MNQSINHVRYLGYFIRPGYFVMKRVLQDSKGYMYFKTAKVTSRQQRVLQYA